MKRILAVLAPLLAAGTALAQGGSGREYDVTMETHAAFFSAETKQSSALDPQVFIREKGSPGAVGPQGIRHAAGLRPALLGDPAGSALYTAEGKPLGIRLGAWLGATGTAHVASNGRMVTVRFDGLVPGGSYSLFENHFDQQPIGFTPLDGTGAGNSFVAATDGSAAATVTAPAPVTHANAVLLVYHSDRATHGASRGTIGITAHHQLIARIP